MNTRDVLHLSLIDGVGPVAINQLIELCRTHAIHDLTQLQVTDLCAWGYAPRMAQLMVKGLADTRVLEQELALVQRHQITLVTIDDAHYPALLRHITAPPSVLYVRGTVPTHEHWLAFVGSRQGTAYAQRFIDQAVPALAALGWGIVSGGALGVDSMAHRAALTAHARTLAVLGSGLLEPYPRDNRALFERIVAEGGALISPFALRTVPDKWNFPARNRIIAGLSRGVVVVQAAARSGALISAYHALEQGREIFAVPGLFDDALSAGCHALIHQGATVACSAQDILREFGLGEEPAQPSVPAVSTDVPVEQRILQACAAPHSLDELIELMALAPDQAYACVLSLQLAGKLRQEATGLFVRV